MVKADEAAAARFVVKDLYLDLFASLGREVDGHPVAIALNRSLVAAVGRVGRNHRADRVEHLRRQAKIQRWASNTPPSTLALSRGSPARAGTMATS